MQTRTDSAITRDRFHIGDRQLRLPEPGAVSISRGWSWAEYELFLAQMGDRAGFRAAFDRGVLEIVSPSINHEEVKRLLGRLVELLAEAENRPYRVLGSATWKKRSAERGIEHDDCFYIQNERLVRGKQIIDLDAGEPPPDLAIEIDVYSSSKQRDDIFATMGVPEIWRFRQNSVFVLKLESDEYVPSEQSLAFPWFSACEPERFLTMARSNSLVEVTEYYQYFLDRELSKLDPIGHARRKQYVAYRRIVKPAMGDAADRAIARLALTDKGEAEAIAILSYSQRVRDLPKDERAEAIARLLKNATELA
ncbi:MAG: Uma2 family endonuclease [Cyanobacteria bacterium J06639_1]